MASAIGPGDFIECVDARPYDWTGERLLVRGFVYQVRAVVDDAIAPDGNDRVSVLLVEIVRPLPSDGAGEPAFDLARFRPCGGPLAEIEQALKAPPKQARKPARENA